MKRRGGFVSNSSSSSFVMIGFEIDREIYKQEDFKKTFLKSVVGMGSELERMDEDEIWDTFMNADLAVPSHEEDGVEGVWVGYRFDMDDGQKFITTFDEIVSGDDFCRALNFFGKGKEDIKIIGGTRMT